MFKRLIMLICVPVREKTQKATIKRLKNLKNKTDLAEIWLDHIKDLDIKGLLKKASMPVICVCKKQEEKGLFKGNYREMAEILTDAVKFGAQYVDIPFEMPKKFVSKIIHTRKLLNAKYEMRMRNPLVRLPDLWHGRGGKCKMKNVIMSFHDFKKTPSFEVMLKKACEMKKGGADIVKIAVTAKSLKDTLSVIFLARQLQSKKIPHILIAMGKKGILSRIITPFLGGTIMFAPLTAKKASASGQLTVKELKDAWGLIKK